MAFCDHCEGQRLDRARVLRELRRLRRELKDAGHRECDAALGLALSAIRSMDIPHLEPEEDLGRYVH